MPAEIEMFERLMQQMKRALMYLDENDDVTLKVTLNLNPELTDWQNSELKNGHFISRFAILFNGIKNINEVILDTSCWGTTQQKRESYKLDYDQFIFCDTDILFHEHMLKHQLNISYLLYVNTIAIYYFGLILNPLITFPTTIGSVLTIKIKYASKIITMFPTLIELPYTTAKEAFTFYPFGIIGFMPKAKNTRYLVFF